MTQGLNRTAVRCASQWAGRGEPRRTRKRVRSTSNFDLSEGVSFCQGQSCSKALPVTVDTLPPPFQQYTFSPTLTWLWGPGEAAAPGGPPGPGSPILLTMTVGPRPSNQSPAPARSPVAPGGPAAPGVREIAAHRPLRPRGDPQKFQGPQGGIRLRLVPLRLVHPHHHGEVVPPGRTLRGPGGPGPCTWTSRRPAHPRFLQRRDGFVHAGETAHQPVVLAPIKLAVGLGEGIGPPGSKRARVVRRGSPKYG